MGSSQKRDLSLSEPFIAPLESPDFGKRKNNSFREMHSACETVCAAGRGLVRSPSPISFSVRLYTGCSKSLLSEFCFSVILRWNASRGETFRTPCTNGRLRRWSKTLPTRAGVDFDLTPGGLYSNLRAIRIDSRSRHSTPVTRGGFVDRSPVGQAGSSRLMPASFGYRNPAFNGRECASSI